MRLPKRLRRAMAVTAVRLLTAAARRLPERVVPAVGRTMGWVGEHLARAEARVARTNMALVCPQWSPAQRRTVTRAMFRHLGVSALEAVRLPAYARATRAARTTVKGLDILDAAFRRGRGVVAATGHIGNWEVLAACFADLGYPVHVVARRHPNPGLNSLIVSLREGYGVRVLDRDRDMRGMLRALHRGEIVALLVDQHTRVQGAMLPFLGEPAYTPLGHARLAVRTGAALVVLTIARDSGGQHAVTVWEEVRPDESLPDELRVEALAARCNEILGEAIRRIPEQWVWFHRRWRPAREATS